MTERKSILVLVSTDLSYDQRVRRICSTLATENDVHVCGHRKPKSIDISQADYSQERIKTLTSRGVMFYLELNIRWLLRFLFKPRDIILANDLDSLLAGGLLSIFWPKAQLVFDAHELFAEVPELQSAPIKRKIWTFLGHRFVPRASLRYSVGKEIALVLSQKYKSPFEVIHNAALLRPPVSAKKESQFTILYQGAVNKGRGLELMLEAIDALPDCQLWIVGDGDVLEDLQEQCKQKKCADRVTFWGYQRPEVLHDLTVKAHLGINVLDGSSQSYALSLANKFYDYVQAEIPAIHSAFPEYQAKLTEYQVGLLCDSYSSQALVILITQIMESPSLYQEMVEQCQLAKLVWNWEAEQERLMDLFRQLHLAQSGSKNSRNSK